MGRPRRTRPARQGWEEQFREANRRGDDLPVESFWSGSPCMSTSTVTFDEVVELALHLSPEERLRLVARIGTELSETSAESVRAEPVPGSAKAVLRAMHEPPHLSGEDVDELERIIAAGKLPVRREGVFESEDAK